MINGETGVGVLRSLLQKAPSIPVQEIVIKRAGRRFQLTAKTPNGHEVQFPIWLRDNAPLSAYEPALHQALRGLAATARLIDSIKPRVVELDFSQFEAVIRHAINPEIERQFNDAETLYQKFYAGKATSRTRGYRIPFYDREK